jgi:hypothetical protein
LKDFRKNRVGVLIAYGTVCGFKIFILGVIQHLIPTDLPQVSAKSGEAFQYLVDFSRSDEFLVSVQAKSVLILLSSHEMWQSQAGFIVQLDGGSSGRESLIKRCLVVDDERSQSCHTGVTLVI